MNSDQELLLVKKAKAGDRQALGELWDAITPKLFGYLINTLKDKTLAEDLLQTTWLKAISALGSFQPRGIGISAWLFAIARNECKQYWRKAQNETEMIPDLHDVAGSNQNLSDNKILVEQMLAKLSKEDQELIRLRYIADLSPSDIAKVLNINFVAVRVRLHRALARAKAAVKRD